MHLLGGLSSRHQPKERLRDAKVGQINLCRRKGWIKFSSLQKKSLPFADSAVLQSLTFVVTPLEQFVGLAMGGILSLFFIRGCSGCEADISIAETRNKTFDKL